MEKNYLKKCIAFSLAMLLVVSSFSLAFAQNIAPVFRDKAGKEIDASKNVKAGEEVIMEYTIQPEDVKVKKQGKTTFDVTFVIDASGSMTLFDIIHHEYEKESRFPVFVDNSVIMVETGKDSYTYTVKDSKVNNYYTNIEDLKNAYLTYYMGKYHCYTINKWLTLEEMQVYHRKTNTEIAVESFLNKVDKNEKFDARVSVISFNFYASEEYNKSKYDKLFNANEKSKFLPISSNKEDIIEVVKGINYDAVTNGGDGLRLAYYLNKDSNSENPKYVVFLSDGMSNESCYTKYWGNLYTGPGHIKSVKDGGHSSAGMDLSIDEEIAMGTEYLYVVGNDLMANSNINKTYVVGIGDRAIEAQYKQNEKNAAISNGLFKYDVEKNAITYNEEKGVTKDNYREMLDKLYFPMQDSNDLADVFESIADDIFETISTKNTKIELPFLTNINFEEKQTGLIPNDMVLVSDIEVDEMKNGVAFPIDNTFEIVEQKDNTGKTYWNLVGGLDNGFKYYYDDDENIYKANPIRIRIHLKVPENFAQDSIQMKETGGSFVFDVMDEKQEYNLENKVVGVTKNIVDKVEATLTINNNSTATLKIKPITDLEMIYLRYADGNPLSSKSHYTKPKKGVEITYNIPANEFEKIKKDLKMMIESHEKFGTETKKFSEDVHVLLFDGVSYNADKYGVNYNPENRKVGYKVKALDGLNSIKYTIHKIDGLIEGKVFEASTSYSEGCYEQEMVLFGNNYLNKSFPKTNGNNSVTAQYKNDYNNVTLLNSDVLVYAMGPELKNLRVEGNTLKSELKTESHDLKSVKVNYVSNSSSKVIVANLTDYNRAFNANLLANPTGIVVDAIDDYNNGSKTKLDISMEIGLYNKAKNDFMPDSSKIAFGYRYSYGIKFAYSGGNIAFEAFDANANGNKINTKVMNYYILDSSGRNLGKALILSGSGTNKIVYSEGSLLPGNYTLVMDCSFTKATAFNCNKITTKVSYNGDTEKDIAVNASPAIE